MENSGFLNARSLYDALLSSTNRFAAHDLIRSDDHAVSYEHFLSLVESVAASLSAQRLAAGDRLAVFTGKETKALATVFAAFSLNIIVVPINPKATPSQVAQILADCGCKWLVTTRARWLRLSSATTEVRAILIDHEPTLADGTLGWKEFSSCSTVAIRPHILDMDPAVIFYTSGSTGAPKGVLLSHRNLLAGACSVASYLNLSSDDTILGVLPLSFDAGFSQFSTAVVSGASYAALDYVRPVDVVATCRLHNVSVITGVPAFWMQATTAAWDSQSADSIRKIATTGGRMPVPLIKRMQSMFKRADMYLMYGFTEAFRSTFLPPHMIESLPESVGKAVPNAQVVVLRPDGSECEPYEHGELVHRGAFVTMGYWNRPEETKHRFRPWPFASCPYGLPEMAAWSGDIAYKNEDGFIFIVGRNDEMIKTSGYRVSPSEVETACFAFDGVSEAIAVGIPDVELGEIVAVCVAADEWVDMEAMKEFVNKALPGYMRPRLWNRMDSLPRNGNGKFDRTRIIDSFAQALV
jgi:acyl-CoA ligase (AMP-forming) (exosortase A-associated)